MNTEKTFKKGDRFNTLRGDAYIVATRNDYHIIDGVHPTLNDGDRLFPSKSNDYVVAFRNPEKNSELDYIYEDLTHQELNYLIVR